MDGHSTETAALLRSLRGVWDEEAVDELDHALQSAARAIDDGADDELVLAAALHDLAHSPLFDDSAALAHDVDRRGLADARGSGSGSGWLAGAHVAAKRYLAATEPGYGAALSRRRRCVSLHAQGGAGVDADLRRPPVVAGCAATAPLRRRRQGPGRAGA